MAEFDMLFKVLIIGDEDTGKSALLTRFTEDIFPESYISTIGVDFRIKTIQHKGKIIKLQIWDTAGQERFRTITTSYYRGCQGVMIVFDVTDRSTFRRVDSWLTDIERYVTGKVAKVLVGNKCDKIEKRCVTEEEAKSLALINNMEYTDASSKENTNVSQAFELLVEEMYENNQDKNETGVALNVAPRTSPYQASQSLKEEEDKVAAVGDGDVPEWAKILNGELSELAKKFDVLDNLKSSVDTLCKKVELLETKVSKLEQDEN